MKNEPATAFRKTVETFVAGARTLPQQYFISPEVFSEEQKKIFANKWVLVGHQSQIPSGGDYFLAEICGESVVVVRSPPEQGAGVIHAFHNVCRHRGTRLKEEVRGHMSAIQCPYHAWTYALDGRLLGAPHMDDVPGFQKAAYSLRPVKIGVFEGFIFLSLANDPIQLERWFAPLQEKFSLWNLPNLRSAKRIEYDVKANWKLIFENYSECYHCPGVHPMLSKVSPYDSAENDLVEGPFLGGFMRINQGRSLTMSGKACALAVDGKREEGEEKEKEELGQRVFYYSIFPNMLLSMHPDYVMVHQIWPRSSDRTLIYCDWFFHPDAFDANGFDPQDAIEFWDITNKQDWHVCELSQQGISSSAYEPGPYSSRESIPAAWDREYLSHVNVA
jgi:glycine betaine catabolism A